jgi:hypothetical protein
VDYSPDYNAAPRSLSGGVFRPDGSFIFNVDHVVPNTTNYLQFTTNVAGGRWQTLGMFFPSTNNFTFTDPDAQLSPQRFYRLSLIP